MKANDHAAAPERKAVTPIEVAQWLAERLANCQRLAATKTGADRDGWLEDAEYFRAALHGFANTQAYAEALRPFAAFSKGFGRTARDDDWVLVKSPSGQRTITMGDVRAAEDVLAKAADK